MLPRHYRSSHANAARTEIRGYPQSLLCLGLPSGHIVQQWKLFVPHKEHHRKERLMDAGQCIGYSAIILVRTASRLH